MNGIKIAAIALILAGVLGLAYGGFTYTKATHETSVGPLSLSVQDRETVNIPIWAGIGAVVIGGVLLVVGSNRKT
ncbi:hypothetical protein [Desulfonatronovibrio magnus]|uniref:hypothetical protein n=1 Tax=Desulfonatronovibrio magnus TaxID=698827 RepID=UPI0005EB32A0|nr:hypothetical protein [Desulfonatronovibrio magnus]